jgi:hypothetical protein
MAHGTAQAQASLTSSSFHLFLTTIVLLQAVVGLLAPVGQLHETLPSLERERLQLDHLYDF